MIVWLTTSVVLPPDLVITLITYLPFLFGAVIRWLERPIPRAFIEALDDMAVAEKLDRYALTRSQPHDDVEAMAVLDPLRRVDELDRRRGRAIRVIVVARRAVGSTGGRDRHRSKTNDASTVVAASRTMWMYFVNALSSSTSTRTCPQGLSVCTSERTHADISVP